MLLKPHSHRRLNCSNMTNFPQQSNKYRKGIIYDENAKQHSRKSSHIPQFLIKANREVLKDNTNMQNNAIRDYYITPHKNNMGKQYQSAHQYYMKISSNHPPIKTINQINQIKSLSKLQQPHQHKNKVKTQGKLQSKSSSQIKSYHQVSLTTRNKNKIKNTPNISQFIIKNNHLSSIRTTNTSKHKISFNQQPNIKTKNPNNNINIYHQFNININQQLSNDSKYYQLSNTLNTSNKNNTPKYFQHSLITKVIDSYIVNYHDKSIIDNFKVIKKLQCQQIDKKIETIRTVESRNLQNNQIIKDESSNRGRFIKNLRDQNIDVYQSITMNNGDGQRAYSQIVLDKLNKLGRQVKQSIIP